MGNGVCSIHDISSDYKSVPMVSMPHIVIILFWKLRIMLMVCSLKGMRRGVGHSSHLLQQGVVLEIFIWVFY